MVQIGADIGGQLQQKRRLGREAGAGGVGVPAYHQMKEKVLGLEAIIAYGNFFRKRSGYPALRQVRGESMMRMGKISSRPISISTIKTTLDSGVKQA